MLLPGSTTHSMSHHRVRARRAAMAAAAAAALAVNAGLAGGQPASAAPLPTVTAVWLIDTDNGAKVAELDHYLTVLDLPYLPKHLSVQAFLDGSASATFTTASGTHPESTAPYTMAGEVGTSSKPVPALSVPGTVAVDITPYALKDAKGTKGTTQNRRIQLRKADYLVTSTADLLDATPGNGVCASSAGTCTVRAAVEEANARSGRQNISIPAGTYALPLGELLVKGDTGLWGHGRPSLQAAGNSRVLRVQGAGMSPTVQAEDLDMAGGNVGDTSWGGVALIANGRLELSRSDVHGGTANMGGGLAVAAAGELQLSTTTVHHNTAGDPGQSSGAGATQRGGGIYSSGKVSIGSSSIADNRATFGAGLSNSGGVAGIYNSSLMGNVAVAWGGGLENRSIDTDADGVTDAVATMMLTFSTITDNKAGFTASSLGPDYRGGGGIWNTGSLSWGLNVVAQNEAKWSGAAYFAPDCWSPAANSVKSLGTNVLGVYTARCGLSLPLGTTLKGTASSPLDPGLLSRTDTPFAARVPLQTSPAVSYRVTDPACPSADVRGRPRTQPCWLGSAQS